MVITPYQKQVKLLNGYLPNVEVLTVDKCQGRDSECVIVSFVKKNAAGQVHNLPIVCFITLGY